MQMRAGVRQGLKANLQGSRRSEAKLPLSSTSSQGGWVMPLMSHFCQMGRVWPTQASAGPCSPPCSWPRGRKLELLHHCISKGKEIKFFTAEIPVAYQCKYERKWFSPPHLLPCLLLILTHTATSEEWCWLLAQNPAGLHTLPSPRPPAPCDHMQVKE